MYQSILQKCQHKNSIHQILRGKKTSAKYSTPCIASKFIFVAFAPIEIQLIDSTRKINYEIIAAIELHKQLIATN